MTPLPVAPVLPFCSKMNFSKALASPMMGISNLYSNYHDTFTTIAAAAAAFAHSRRVE
jgi:hypothetical protein